MKKHVWFTFIILSGIFMLTTTLVEMFNDTILYLSSINSLILIITSIVLVFFQGAMGIATVKNRKPINLHGKYLYP